MAPHATELAERSDLIRGRPPRLTPVRIGMVCPYSLSVPGGVQGQVLGLARALRAGGHEVRVLAPTDGPPPDSGVTSLGTSILNPSNGSVAPIAPDPATQLRAIRSLWDERFDVVHVHEPFCPGPSVTAVILKSAPLVGTFHAAGHQPAYRYLGGLARTLARRLDVKVAVSAEAQALASEAIPGGWTLLFNGVEVERFAEAEPWPTEGPTLLFVGRHEERKGLAVFLDSLSRLPRDLRVWVAGEGPETEGLRARHGHDERIEWLGRISDSERDRRMAAASVFVAPSIRGESFGVILLEAMAAGAPVVASDLVGYRAVAGPIPGAGPAAELVTVGDPGALADAIRRVLDDPARAAELVIAGRRRAEHFSMDRLASLYSDLYERILGGVPGATPIDA